MKKVGIFYASMTGNTEEIGYLLKEYIEQHSLDYQISMRRIKDATPYELLDYDIILLGTYTWGNGDLPDEYFPFYDDMENVDLKGKVISIFGSGDESYKTFCFAVDILKEKVESLNAILKVNPLKIELFPNRKQIPKCEKFIEELLK